MSDNDIDVDDDWLYGESDVTEVEPVQENTLENADKTNGLDNTTEDAASKEINDDEYVDMLQPPIIEAPNKIIDEQEEIVTEKDETNDKADSPSKDDEEDDNINVVIGDIGPISYSSSLPVRRGNLFTLSNQTTGKWTVEDMESVGKINNIPAYDFDLDSLPEKPWLKPGANISDYFNYGFSEQTWKDYCLRQKELEKATISPNARVINVIGAQKRIEPNNVIDVMTADFTVNSNMSVPPPTLTPAPTFTELPPTDGEYANNFHTSFDSSTDDQWINQEWGSGSDMKNVVSLGDARENGEEDETKSEGTLDSIEETEDGHKSRDGELEQTKERSKQKEKSRRDRSRSRSHGKKSKRNRSRSRSTHHKKKKAKKTKSKEQTDD